VSTARLGATGDGDAGVFVLVTAGDMPTCAVLRVIGVLDAIGVGAVEPSAALVITRTSHQWPLE
jgi:hypothetical protein